MENEQFTLIDVIEEMCLSRLGSTKRATTGTEKDVCLKPMLVAMDEQANFVGLVSITAKEISRAPVCNRLMD